MKQALELKAERWFRGDIFIWSIFVGLIIASLLAVYSSTHHLAYKLHGGNTEWHLMRHSVFVMIGCAVLYGAYRMPHTRFAKVAPYLLLLSIGLLVLTLAFGIDINHARRWLEIPVIGVRFQPSDVAKIALILYLARALAGMQDHMHDGAKIFWRIVFPVLLVCALIAPNDLSTAGMLGITCFGLMFIARLPFKWIGTFVGLVLLMVGAMYAVWLVAPESVRFATWFSRVGDFIAGDGGYQVDQAKIAIANGNVLGLGAGRSTQRNFLPTPYADFIYAIICEEYGLIGGGLILMAFLLLFIRACRLLTKSTKLFGALLACGLSLLLVAQALANIAVSVNLVPVTGLTLPLVSLGGTSLVFSCLAIGMILSVSRQTERPKKLRGTSKVSSEGKGSGGLQVSAA